MLRFFQRYHRSALGLIIALIVCVAMLGFGVNMGGGSRADYAIKVNDQEISYDTVQQRRREFEGQYRRMTGGSFYDLPEELRQNIMRQFVDGIVEQALVNQMAERSDLVVGPSEIGQNVRAMFGGNFSKVAYEQFLRQMNMSAGAFESELRSDLLERQVVQMLAHASAPSEQEIVQMLREAETTYAVRYVEIDPAVVVDTVPEPKAEELEEYYTNNALLFEREEKVQYDYLALEPKDFLDMVEVLDEDVELYYTEHQRDFRTPPKVRAKHIQLTYSPDASPKEMAELAEQAAEIADRAKSGEDFDSLVQQFSDDIPTKVNNGNLGWIEKGERSAAFEEEVFAMAAPGIADVIEEDYGYHIVKVEEIQEADLQPIEEVRDEIERRIREREAPAYAAVKAQEIFDQWLKSGDELSEFAAKNNLAVVAGKELLAKEEDPSEAMTGLTAKVLGGGEQQLLDLGNKIVLVDVEQRQEPDVPPLEEIRAEVIQTWKKQQAAERTREIAQAIAQHEEGSLVELAKEQSLELQEQTDLKQRAAFGLFRNPAVQEQVFKGRQAQDRISDAVEVDGKSYVFQVTATTPPTEEELQQSLAGYRNRARSELIETLRSSVLNKLKADAEIYVQPGVGSI